jgi:hypothetical protein
MITKCSILVLKKNFAPRDRSFFPTQRAYVYILKAFKYNSFLEQHFAPYLESDPTQCASVYVTVGTWNFVFI